VEETFKVAASPVPHAEILEQVRDDLFNQGINLEIILVEDYQSPNRLLADREVDANYFQHRPFLEDQVQQYRYPIESFASIHLEPMGLYSARFKSLSDLPHGALIAVPSDLTNQARALRLLEKNGLIVMSTHDSKTSILNVRSNPKDVRIIDADSSILAKMLNDVDLAAITTNVALQAYLSPTEDALILEDKESPFVNVIAIRRGESNRKELQALKKALQSEKTRAFIQSRYQGAVLPGF
jgi:D-methionine transport system substrate-binding protein